MSRPAGNDATFPATQLVLRNQWSSPPMLLRELWQSRDLCLTLARKDFFVRYRRAVFGVLWAVALPGVQAIVLAVILTRVATIHVHKYPLFIFSGLVCWTYFTGSLTAGATSIVDNAGLSSRIYFPRLVLPISACLSNVFTLVATTIAMLVAAVAVGEQPGLHTLTLVPAVALILLFTLSLTSLLAALHVYFRDIRYVVQTAMLVWFYVTPIFYPNRLLHGWAGQLVRINPVTGAAELFHASVVPGFVVDWSSVLASVLWSISLGGVALVLHCKWDRFFADLL